MMNKTANIPALTLLLILSGTAPLYPSAKSGFRVEVMVDGVPVPEYRLNGTTYIEALKGKEYTVQLTNPLPVRAVVALSVDGLNTIDARHTDAWAASKWVLEPHETITIHGWQTGSGEARKFFFTKEENSYGAWLGKTANLGVISAVFFRERIRPVERRPVTKDSRLANEPPMAAGSAAHEESGQKSRTEDEYAATGMGDRFRHRVQRVFLELEREPCASFSVRYEFRPVLARLGVLPPPEVVLDPLERRRRARGFEDMPFCPTP